MLEYRPLFFLLWPSQSALAFKAVSSGDQFAFPPFLWWLNMIECIILYFLSLQMFHECMSWLHKSLYKQSLLFCMCSSACINYSLTVSSQKQTNKQRKKHILWIHLFLFCSYDWLVPSHTWITVVASYVAYFSTSGLSHLSQENLYLVKLFPIVVCSNRRNYIYFLRFAILITWFL